MSYYASFYADVEQDPLTLSGSHRPGHSNLESSDSQYDYHPSVSNGSFACHFMGAPSGSSYHSAPVERFLGQEGDPAHRRQAYPASCRDPKPYRKSGEVAFNEEDYRENSRPKLENFRHGHLSIKLPILPHKKAPVLHKQAALALTIKRITGVDGKAFEKYEALNYRLTAVCPEAELKAETIAATLEDIAEDIFTFFQVTLVNEDKRPIELITGPSNKLTADLRQHATYIRFQLTVNPRKLTIPNELERSLPSVTWKF